MVTFWENFCLTRIVGAKRQEVIPIDGKKAPSMGGTWVGFASVLTFWRLPLRKFCFLKTHIMQGGTVQISEEKQTEVYMFEKFEQVQRFLIL